jgi:hypothetical protein
VQVKQVEKDDGWFYPKFLLVLGGCLMFAHFLEQWLPVEAARCVSYFLIPLCNYRFLGADRRISFTQWSLRLTLLICALVILKIIGFYLVMLRLSR